MPKVQGKTSKKKRADSCGKLVRWLNMAANTMQVLDKQPSWVLPLPFYLCIFSGATALDSPFPLSFWRHQPGLPMLCLPCIQRFHVFHDPLIDLGRCGFVAVVRHLIFVDGHELRNLLNPGPASCKFRPVKTDLVKSSMCLICCWIICLHGVSDQFPTKSVEPIDLYRAQHIRSY